MSDNLTGNAQISTRYNLNDGDYYYRLQINGLSSSQLQASHFNFNGVVANQTITGTTRNDDLFGGLGNDTLQGDIGQDRLFGEQGDDRLQGSVGNDTLYGGAGDDTAVYTGSRSQYSWTTISGGFRITDSVTNRDGIDTLYGIQKLQFSDQIVPISPLEGEVTRLSINDVTIVEGNAGTTNATFTITRTGSLAQSTTVTYSTANGTASPGSDYTTTTGNVTFGVNETTKTVVVPIIGDTTLEPNETFFVNLTNPTNSAVLVDSQGLGTIINDDTAPSLPTVTLTLAPTSVVENGTPNLVYTFTRTGSLTNPLTVNYTIAGTATQGTDYNNIPTSVTFAANSSTATVIVDPTDDTLVESAESVSLTLSPNSAYTVGTTTAVTGTITDNDVVTLPQVTLSLNYSGISENSPTNFIYTFTRTGVLTNPLTVNYTVGGTATNGVDYNNIATSVTFAANSSTATVIVNPTEDTTVETNETISLSLTNSTSYASGTTSPVTATIINDDGTRLPRATSGNDVILGTSKVDAIYGLGGNDILTGGANGDSFGFRNTREGIDTITDFTPDTDFILVSAAGFGGALVAGELNAAQFVIGTAATSSNQRFIYNPTSGALLFDTDGSNGSNAAVQFAQLTPNLSLTFEDILLG